ncbi:alanine racemase [Nocardia sp. NPDC004278]
MDIAPDVEVRGRTLWEGYLSRLGVEHLPDEAPPPTWWQQRPWPPEPDADLPQWDSMSHRDLEARLQGALGADEQIGAFLEVLRRESGQVIRPNQLMMALHMSDGGFVNLRAGGGKTLPFREAAAFMALKHGSVVQLSSHEYLADRDMEGFVKAFGKYGFKTARLNPDAEYAELDGPTVFFGTDGELVHGDQRGNIVPARALLADEACEVLGLTHENGKTYAIVDGDDHDLPGPEADKVIKARDFLDGALANGVLKEADFRPLSAVPAEAGEHGGARLNPVGLSKMHATLGRAPTEEELHRLNNAATAHFDYPEKDTWFNSGGEDPQVVLISRTTHEPEGNAGSSGAEAVHMNQPDPKQAEGQAPENAQRGATLSRVENGIHQALEAIAQKSDPSMRIRAEHDKSQQINSKEYFSRESGRFDVVSGASGTLSHVPSERLEQLGWGEVFEAPDYYEDVLVQLDDHESAETPAANLQQVFDAALADYQAGRPVIVGAVRNGEVEQLVAMAEKAGIPFMYIDAQEQWRLNATGSFHAHMTELAGKHQKMVIGNFAVGRGFDRHVSQDTWETGGLALHGTARPDDVAFEQLRRRAARGGVPGSARFGGTTALAPDPHSHVSVHHVPRSGEQNHAPGKQPYGLKRLGAPAQPPPDEQAAGSHHDQQQYAAAAAPKPIALHTIPHSPTDIDVRDSAQPQRFGDQAVVARRDAEPAAGRQHTADQDPAASGRHSSPAASIPTHTPSTTPQTPTTPTPTSAPVATNAPTANHTATSPQTPNHQAPHAPVTPGNAAAPRVTPHPADPQSPLTPQASSGNSPDAYGGSVSYAEPASTSTSSQEHERARRVFAICGLSELAYIQARYGGSTPVQTPYDIFGDLEGDEIVDIVVANGLGRRELAQYAHGQWQAGDLADFEFWVQASEHKPGVNPRHALITYQEDSAAHEVSDDAAGERLRFKHAITLTRKDSQPTVHHSVMRPDGTGYDEQILIGADAIEFLEQLRDKQVEALLIDENGLPIEFLGPRTENVEWDDEPFGNERIGLAVSPDAAPPAESGLLALPGDIQLVRLLLNQNMRLARKTAWRKLTAAVREQRPDDSVTVEPTKALLLVADPANTQAAAFLASEAARLAEVITHCVLDVLRYPELAAALTAAGVQVVPLMPGGRGRPEAVAATIAARLGAEGATVAAVVSPSDFAGSSGRDLAARLRGDHHRTVVVSLTGGDTAGRPDPFNTAAREAGLRRTTFVTSTLPLDDDRHLHLGWRDGHRGPYRGVRADAVIHLAETPKSRESDNADRSPGYGLSAAVVESRAKAQDLNRSQGSFVARNLLWVLHAGFDKELGHGNVSVSFGEWVARLPASCFVDGYLDPQEAVPAAYADTTAGRGTPQWYIRRALERPPHKGYPRSAAPPSDAPSRETTRPEPSERDVIRSLRPTTTRRLRENAAKRAANQRQTAAAARDVLGSANSRRDELVEDFLRKHGHKGLTKAMVDGWNLLRMPEQMLADWLAGADRMLTLFPFLPVRALRILNLRSQKRPDWRILAEDDNPYGAAMAEKNQMTGQNRMSAFFNSFWLPTTDDPNRFERAVRADYYHGSERNPDNPVADPAGYFVRENLDPILREHYNTLVDRYRALRVYIAFAEELDFTRAAQRLGMPVRRFYEVFRGHERRFGAPLFDPDTRSLTENGTEYLEQARTDLAAFERAALNSETATYENWLRRGLPAQCFTTDEQGEPQLIPTVVVSQPWQRPANPTAAEPSPLWAVHRALREFLADPAVADPAGPRVQENLDRIWEDYYRDLVDSGRLDPGTTSLGDWLRRGVPAECVDYEAKRLDRASVLDHARRLPGNLADRELSPLFPIQRALMREAQALSHRAGRQPRGTGRPANDTARHEFAHLANIYGGYYVSENLLDILADHHTDLLDRGEDIPENLFEWLRQWLPTDCFDPDPGLPRLLADETVAIAFTDVDINGAPEISPQWIIHKATLEHAWAVHEYNQALEYYGEDHVRANLSDVLDEVYTELVASNAITEDRTRWHDRWLRELQRRDHDEPLEGWSSHDPHERVEYHRGDSADLPADAAGQPYQDESDIPRGEGGSARIPEMTLTEWDLQDWAERNNISASDLDALRDKVARILNGVWDTVDALLGALARTTALEHKFRIGWADPTDHLDARILAAVDEALRSASLQMGTTALQKALEYTRQEPQYDERALAKEFNRCARRRGLRLRISERTVAEWRDGAVIPRPAYWQTIADALGLEVADLELPTPVHGPQYPLRDGPFGEQERRHLTDELDAGFTLDQLADIHQCSRWMMLVRLDESNLLDRLNTQQPTQLHTDVEVRRRVVGRICLGTGERRHDGPVTPAERRYIERAIAAGAHADAVALQLNAKWAQVDEVLRATGTAQRVDTHDDFAGQVRAAVTSGEPTSWEPAQWVKTQVDAQFPDGSRFQVTPHPDASQRVRAKLEIAMGSPWGNVALHGGQIYRDVAPYPPAADSVAGRRLGMFFAVIGIQNEYSKQFIEATPSGPRWLDHPIPRAEVMMLWEQSAELQADFAVANAHGVFDMIMGAFAKLEQHAALTPAERDARAGSTAEAREKTLLIDEFKRQYPKKITLVGTDYPETSATAVRGLVRAMRWARANGYVTDVENLGFSPDLPTTAAWFDPYHRHIRGNIIRAADPHKGRLDSKLSYQSGKLAASPEDIYFADFVHEYVHAMVDCVERILGRDLAVELPKVLYTAWRMLVEAGLVDEPFATWVSRLPRYGLRPEEAGEITRRDENAVTIDLSTGWQVRIWLGVPMVSVGLPGTIAAEDDLVTGTILDRSDDSVVVGLSTGEIISVDLDTDTVSVVCLNPHEALAEGFAATDIHGGGFGGPAWVCHQLVDAANRHAAKVEQAAAAREADGDGHTRSIERAYTKQVYAQIKPGTPVHLPAPPPKAEDFRFSSGTATAAGAFRDLYGKDVFKPAEVGADASFTELASAAGAVTHRVDAATGHPALINELRALGPGGSALVGDITYTADGYGYEPGTLGEIFDSGRRAQGVTHEAEDRVRNVLYVVALRDDQIVVADPETGRWRPPNPGEPGHPDADSTGHTPGILRLAILVNNGIPVDRPLPTSQIRPQLASGTSARINESPTDGPEPPPTRAVDHPDELEAFRPGRTPWTDNSSSEDTALTDNRDDSTAKSDPADPMLIDIYGHSSDPEVHDPSRRHNIGTPPDQDDDRAGKVPDRPEHSGQLRPEVEDTRSAEQSPTSHPESTTQQPPRPGNAEHRRDANPRDPSHPAADTVADGPDVWKSTSVPGELRKIRAGIARYAGFDRVKVAQWLSLSPIDLRAAWTQIEPIHRRYLKWLADGRPTEFPPGVGKPTPEGLGNLGTNAISALLDAVPGTQGEPQHDQHTTPAEEHETDSIREEPPSSEELYAEFLTELARRGIDPASVGMATVQIRDVLRQREIRGPKADLGSRSSQIFLARAISQLCRLNGISNEIARTALQVLCNGWGIAQFDPDLLYAPRPDQFDKSDEHAANKWLTATRNYQGATQKEFAGRHLTKNIVDNIESERKRPSAQDIVNICIDNDIPRAIAIAALKRFCNGEGIDRFTPSESRNSSSGQRKTLSEGFRRHIVSEPYDPHSKQTSTATDEVVQTNRLHDLIESNGDLLGTHIEWDRDRKRFLIRSTDGAVVMVELRPHSDPDLAVVTRPLFVGTVDNFGRRDARDYELDVDTRASDVAAMRGIARRLEVLRAQQQHYVEDRAEEPEFRIDGTRAIVTAELMGRFAELRCLVGVAERDGAAHGSELRRALDELAADLQLRPGDPGFDTRMAQLAAWDRGSHTAQRFRKLMPEWASGSDAGFDQAFLESKAAEFEQLRREGRLDAPFSGLLRRDDWVKSRPPGSTIGFPELLRHIEADLAFITREHVRWEPRNARFTFVDEQGARVEVAVWIGHTRWGGATDFFYSHRDDRYDIVVDSRLDEAHVAQAVADALGRIWHRTQASIQLDLIGRRAVQLTEGIAGLFSQMSVVVGRLERAVAAAQSDLVPVLTEDLQKTIARTEQALSEEEAASWTALLAARDPLLAERAAHWVSIFLPEYSTFESSLFDEPEFLEVRNVGEFRAGARPATSPDLSNSELKSLINADLDLITDGRISWNGQRTFKCRTARGELVQILVEVHPVKAGVVAYGHRTLWGSYSLRLSPRTHQDDVLPAVKGVLEEILERYEPSPRPWWARRFGQLGLVVKKLADAEGRELSDHASTLGRKLVALAADIGMRPTDPNFSDRLAALAEYDDQLAAQFEEQISRLANDRLPVSSQHQARPQSVLSFRTSAIRHNSTLVGKATPARVIGTVWDIAPVETARAMREGGVEALHASLRTGLQLRAAGETMPIISPGSAIDAEAAAAAINADITLTVSSIEQLHTVARTARVLATTAKIAVEFDTGKHAGGISPSQRLELIEHLSEYSDVIVDVHCFTELAHDDDPWHPMNDQQVHLMHQLALDGGPYHVAGDALAARPELCRSPAVRLGAPLYGYLPGESQNLALQPSITRWARVSFVQTVPADEGTGYLGVPAGRERQIAWVGLGYLDGVPHDLGGWDQGLWVLINGVRCPIAGPVSMDQFPVEVPAGVHVSEGDIVLLAGPGIDGEPTLQQWSIALDVPVDQFSSAPPGRTRVVLHDGTDLVMDPMYRRSSVDPRIASASAMLYTDALANNLTVSRRRFTDEIEEYNEIHGTTLTPPRIMLVVKANAYGFDAEFIAHAAEAAGIDAIGAAQIDELVKLRASGIGVPLLAWQTNPRSDFESAIRSNVAVGVSSAAVLRAVAAAAELVGEPATVHLAVNTGLNREGLSPEELAQLIPLLLEEVESGRIVLEGFMSHADLDETKWDRHYQRFVHAVDILAEAGLHPSVLHLWASVATDVPADRLMAMVRMGTTLFGQDWDFRPDPELQDVLHIRTRVAGTMQVRAGDGAGLHHRWTAERDTTLALIPVGYADLPLPNPNMPFEVSIKGKRYPKVGLAERHHILVDLGSDSVIGANTEVVLLGAAERGEPTVADWVEAGFAQGPALGPGIHVETVSSPPDEAATSEPNSGPQPSRPTIDPPSAADDDPEPDPTTSRDEASVAAARPTDDNQVELDTPATGQVDAECAEYALRTAADLRTPDGTPVFDVKVPDAAAIAEAKEAGYYPRAAISWYAGGQHEEYRGGYHGLADALTQLSIASSDGIAGILVNIAPTGEKKGHVFLAYHDGTTMWLRALHKNIPDQPFNPNNPPFDTKTVHGITLTRHGTTQTIESRREAFQDHAVPEGFVRPPDTSGALPRRGMRLLRRSANNDGSSVIPGRRGGNRSDSNTARPNPRWAKLPGGGHLFIPAAGGDWPTVRSPGMGQPTKREVLSREEVWPTYLGDVLNAFGTNTAQRGMVSATNNPVEAGIALAPIGLAQLAAIRAGIMKRDPREVMRWSTAGGSAASLAAAAALLAGNGLSLGIALPLATGAEAFFATYFINAVQRDLGHALRPGEESIVGGLLALPIGALAGGFLGPFLAGQAGYLPQAFDAAMWMAAFGVLRFLPKDHSAHTPEASRGFLRSMHQAVRELVRALGADSVRSMRQAVRELGADKSFRRFIIPVSLSNLALADLMFHFSNVVRDSGQSPAIQGAATAAFAAGGVGSMLAPAWMKNWIEELEFRHLASATLVGSAGLTAVASAWDNIWAMAAAQAGLGVLSTIITARIFTYLKENFPGDSFALATGGKDAAIGFAAALGTFVAGFVEVSHNHALESLVPIGAAGIGAGLYIGSVLREKASQRQEEAPHRQEEAQRRQDAVLFESKRLDMTGSKGEKTLSFVYDVGNDVAEYLLTEVKQIVHGLASMPQGLTPRVLFVDPGLKHAAAVANPDFIRDHGRAHEIKRNRLRDLIVAAQRANSTGAAARDQLTRVLHKAGLLLADGGVNVLFGIDRDQVEVLCEALSELFPETLWGYASLVTAERGHESQDHAARMAGDVLQTGLGRLAVHRRLQHAALKGPEGRRRAARAAKRWVKLAGSEPTKVEPDLIPARTTESVETSAVSQQAVAESDLHASAEDSEVLGGALNDVARGILRVTTWEDFCRNDPDATAIHAFEAKTARWMSARPGSMRERMETFAAGQLCLVDLSGQLLGTLSTNRIDWDGDPNSLSAGHETAGAEGPYHDTYSHTGNTLCILEVNIAPNVAPEFALDPLIDSLFTFATRENIEHLIGFFRPSGYALSVRMAHHQNNPIPTFAEYVDEIQNDGTLAYLTERFDMQVLEPENRTIQIPLSTIEFETFRRPDWILLDTAEGPAWWCGEAGFIYQLPDGSYEYRENNVLGVIPVPGDHAEAASSTSGDDGPDPIPTIPQDGALPVAGRFSEGTGVDTDIPPSGPSDTPHIHSTAGEVRTPDGTRAQAHPNNAYHPELPDTTRGIEDQLHSLYPIELGQAEGWRRAQDSWSWGKNPPGNHNTYNPGPDRTARSTAKATNTPIENTADSHGIHTTEDADRSDTPAIHTPWTVRDSIPTSGTDTTQPPPPEPNPATGGGRPITPWAPNPLGEPLERNRLFDEQFHASFTGKTPTSRAATAPRLGEDAGDSDRTIVRTSQIATPRTSSSRDLEGSTDRRATPWSPPQPVTYTPRTEQNSRTGGRR